jgi:hypothetical protein
VSSTGTTPRSAVRERVTTSVSTTEHTTSTGGVR